VLLLQLCLEPPLPAGLVCLLSAPCLLVTSAGMVEGVSTQGHHNAATAAVNSPEPTSLGRTLHAGSTGGHAQENLVSCR
jgi:hypothetical protein